MGEDLQAHVDLPRRSDALATVFGVQKAGFGQHTDQTRAPSIQPQSLPIIFLRSRGVTRAHWRREGKLDQKARDRAASSPARVSSPTRHLC